MGEKNTEICVSEKSHCKQLMSCRHCWLEICAALHEEQTDDALLYLHSSYPLIVAFRGDIVESDAGRAEISACKACIASGEVVRVTVACILLYVCARFTQGVLERLHKHFAQSVRSRKSCAKHFAHPCFGRFPAILGSEDIYWLCIDFLHEKLRNPLCDTLLDLINEQIEH